MLIDKIINLALKLLLTIMLFVSIGLLWTHAWACIMLLIAYGVMLTWFVHMPNDKDDQGGRY
jgi:hypothetical protein